MKSYDVTIQMKATEQHFPLVLSIMLYKVVLAFAFVDESLSVTIQMKATEPHFPVVLFIILYKLVLIFESVDEIRWCDHSFSHGDLRHLSVPHISSSILSITVTLKPQT